MTEVQADAELANEFASFSASIAKPKRGRPTASGRSATPRRSLGPVKDGIETLVTVANNAFQSGSKWGRYALSNPEIKSLTNALMIELEGNAKARNLIAKLGGASPHLPLIECCLSIGLSRYVMYQSEKGGMMRYPEAAPPAPIRPEPVATIIPDVPPEQERIYPETPSENGAGERIAHVQP